jgi:hypothetical protein
MTGERRGAPAAAVLCLASLLLGGWLLVARASADIIPGATVDGPSPDIRRLGAVGLARDGGGGVVYVKRDAGVDHIFVSRLVSGSFQLPERVDPGLPGPSSSPVIASGDMGRLAVAYLSGGALYAVIAPQAGAGFTAPQLLSQSAVNPSIAMSLHGAGYLSFTVPGMPAQVRAAHVGLTGTAFSVLDGALNADPSRNAGDTPLKRSQIAVSADGTAMVVWAEDAANGLTHVYERRVLRTAIGAPPMDANLPSLDGHAGGSADGPEVRVEDNSGFAFVTFRQAFDDSGTPRPRAIARTLRGSAFDSEFKVDTLAFPAPEGSGAPSLDANGGGGGVTAAGLDATHEVVYSWLHGLAFSTAQRADSQPNVLAPLPVVAIGENGQGIIAWQQSTGPADEPVVHARTLLADGTLGTETLASVAAQGPVDATNGFDARADSGGDAIVGFVQSGPTGLSISVAVQAQVPAFPPAFSKSFRRSAQPRLTWNPAGEFFGVVRYRVVLDGRAIGVTSASSLVPVHRIHDGVHRVQVFAVGQRGLQTAGNVANLGIDTTPPRVNVSQRGSSVVVRVSDPVASSAGGRRVSSGIAHASISWGDGSSSATRATASHRYTGAGHTLRVVVSDRAGNVLQFQRSV